MMNDYASVSFMQKMLILQSVVLTTCDANQQNRNYQTNVVRLRRFHVQQFHKYDLIASRLSKMLLSAPNQQLPLTDVIKSFVSSELNTDSAIDQVQLEVKSSI